MKIRTLFVIIVFLISFLFFPVDSYSKGGGREAEAGEGAAEEVENPVRDLDIKEATMEAIMGAVGVMEVIIMDFSFLESMVMAIVAISSEVTAIPAIQG